MVAHQFKPGQVANPLGAGAVSRDKRELYRLARRKALDAAPEAIDIQIQLMRCADPRVAVIATNSVLDRAGIKAIDQPDFEEDRARFDASLLTDEQLEQVEAALRLMATAMRAPEGAPLSDASADV
ncbi:MAG: hypothetical protein ACREE4_10710 [Stellaceae bacterium]